MEKILEWSIYIVFGLLLMYKMINDYISERLENIMNFSLYTLITIHLILADISANIIWVVLIGTIIFVPAIINRSYEEDADDLPYAVEILLATVNIFIILVKFGIMRIILGM